MDSSLSSSARVSRVRRKLQVRVDLLEERRHPLLELLAVHALVELDGDAVDLRRPLAAPSGPTARGSQPWKRLQGSQRHVHRLHRRGHDLRLVDDADDLQLELVCRAGAGVYVVADPLLDPLGQGLVDDGRRCRRRCRRTAPSPWSSFRRGCRRAGRCRSPPQPAVHALALFVDRGCSPARPARRHAGRRGSLRSTSSTCSRDAAARVVLPADLGVHRAHVACRGRSGRRGRPTRSRW